MVSDLDTGRCFSEEGGHEAVYHLGCWASKGGGSKGSTQIQEGNDEDAGPGERWIVRSHLAWGGERDILYKGGKTSLCFENIEGKLRELYLLTVGLRLLQLYR